VRPYEVANSAVACAAPQSISQSVESANNQIQRALNQAEQQTSESFSYQVSGPPKEVRMVLDCVQRANTGVDKIQRCID
jgi:hypothetical protein